MQKRNNKRKKQQNEINDKQEVLETRELLKEDALLEEFLVKEVLEETEEVKEEKQEKFQNAKILGKLFLVPLSIICATLVLFFTFLGLNLNFKSHFIAPSKQELYGQQETEYLVATYLRSDKTSIEFVDNLKKTAEELNIGWYLIDIDKYPRVIQEWNITKSPTYHLINRVEQKLVYASYGNKHYTALVKEVQNVKTYGMPQNDIGSEKKVGDLTVTLKEIQNIKDEKYKKVVFKVNNAKSEEIVIRENNISAKYSNFKNENRDYEYKLRGEDFENVSIKAGAEKEIELWYNAEEVSHFQVEFTFSFEGKEAKFTYKLWHNE